MSGERFTEGELFVYVNGYRWELGMVKRPNNTGDGYFCWYSTGDTAANTPVDHMHKLANHGFTKMEGLLRAATSASDATGERQAGAAPMDELRDFFYRCMPADIERWRDEDFQRVAHFFGAKVVDPREIS